MNLNKSVLVRLTPCSSDFTALTTHDAAHGKSCRFLLGNRKIRELTDNDQVSYLLDHDLTNYIRIYRDGSKLHVACINDCQDKAKLDFSDSAHLLIRKYSEDKLIRHALRTFFRDNLNYGADMKVIIYPDAMVKGFYFRSSCGMDGGIVQHEGMTMGKDGKLHRRVYYSVHT